MGATWAIVPAKALAAAKSRLAGMLSAAQREMLSALLLERTLQVLRSAQGLAGIAVISRDAAVWSLARRHEVLAIAETTPAGLNYALRQAIEALPRAAEAALVLPADLPMVQASDVESMLEYGARDDLVIAPDRREVGTNALLIGAPGGWESRFGEDSFRQHVIQALRRGMDVRICRRRALALDLDWPADLAAWLEWAGQEDSAPLDRRLLAEALRSATREGRSQ
jgi:2-phospho-L-lactate/phosphoenolpyruvate guanylyltransferase